jgi:hypothetical protein
MSVKYVAVNEELAYHVGTYPTVSEAMKKCLGKCRKHSVLQIDEGCDSMQLSTFSLLWGMMTAEVTYNDPTRRTLTLVNQNNTTRNCNTDEQRQQTREDFLYQLDAMRMFAGVEKVKITSCRGSESGPIPV